VKDKI